jgi:hypothetical protein
MVRTLKMAMTAVVRQSAAMAPADEREYEAQIRRDVEQHGCHVAIVPQGQGGTLCAFTIGLWRTHRHPEVVVFGMARATAEELLDLVQDEVETGRVFAAGARDADLLHGYPLEFRAVEQTRVAMFEPAVEFHGGADFPMLQAFWPDRRGRFPWDEGVQEHCRRSQPQLDRAGP